MKSFSPCQVPHFLPEANTILYWHAFLKVFNITANTCILKQYTAFNFNVFYECYPAFIIHVNLMCPYKFVFIQ